MKPKHPRCPSGDGKKAYPDYDTALRAALGAARRWAVSPRVYQCPTSQTWHLTSSRTNWWTRRPA